MEVTRGNGSRDVIYGDMVAAWSSWLMLYIFQSKKKKAKQSKSNHSNAYQGPSCSIMLLLP